MAQRPAKYMYNIPQIVYTLQRHGSTKIKSIRQIVKRFPTFAIRQPTPVKSASHLVIKVSRYRRHARCHQLMKQLTDIPFASSDDSSR